MPSNINLQINPHLQKKKLSNKIGQKNVSRENSLKYFFLPLKVIERKIFANKNFILQISESFRYQTRKIVTRYREERVMVAGVESRGKVIEENKCSLFEIPLRFRFMRILHESSRLSNRLPSQ